MIAKLLVNVAATAAIAVSVAYLGMIVQMWMAGG
jgi:hypothetical protein